jgi:hypothetical protein
LRQIRRRIPKNAVVVDTYLPRGHKNDGLIEIENEDEAEFKDVAVNGSHTIYRLPERGIKLDWIERVKQ